MIVRKIDGVYRGTGRGEGKSDVVICRGEKRWDIFEAHGEHLELLASDLSFNAAQFFDNPEFATTIAPERRKTRIGPGIHKIGPITMEKCGSGWKVFCGAVELRRGIRFTDARRLAEMEEKKVEMVGVKLAMSFVPYPIRSINLHRRLALPQWRKLSKESYDRAGGVCEICGTAYPRLDCHEEWEYDDLLLVQRLKRLTAICYLCHRSIHFNTCYILSDDALAKVVDHFKSVNQVDDAAMSRHDEVATWIYEKRCGDWTVDFGEYAELVATYPRIIKTRKPNPLQDQAGQS